MDDGAEQERHICVRADEVIGRVLAGLRDRRAEVRAVTRGRPLRVQVTLIDDEPRTFRVIVTHEGRVAVVSQESLGGTPFGPNLSVSGRAAVVLEVFLGLKAWELAEAEGTLIADADPSEYLGVRELIASHLRDVMGGMG